MLSNLLKPIRTAFQILLLFPRILAYYSVRLKHLTEDYQNYRSTDSKNSVNMDAEQRYTEEATFDFSDEAFEKVQSLRALGYHLSMSIHKGSGRFSIVNGIIQEYTVMISAPEETDIPFSLMILNQEGDIPILVDFKMIDMDFYLESIIKKKSITHEAEVSSNTINS